MDARKVCTNGFREISESGGTVSGSYFHGRIK